MLQRCIFQYVWHNPYQNFSKRMFFSVSKNVTRLFFPIWYVCHDPYPVKSHRVQENANFIMKTSQWELRLMPMLHIDIKPRNAKNRCFKHSALTEIFDQKDAKNPKTCKLWLWHHRFGNPRSFRLYHWHVHMYVDTRLNVNHFSSHSCC